MTTRWLTFGGRPCFYRLQAFSGNGGLSTYNLWNVFFFITKQWLIQFRNTTAHLIQLIMWMWMQSYLFFFIVFIGHLFCKLYSYFVNFSPAMGYFRYKNTLSNIQFSAHPHSWVMLIYLQHCTRGVSIDGSSLEWRPNLWSKKTHTRTENTT